MKNLLKISALALFLAVGAFTVVGLTPTKVNAQEAAEQTQENTEAPAASPYSYTAQPGDSFTKIARKAVQTYGFNKNVNLSQAQIVAAETFLTNDAGQPSITVGQSVTLTEDAVKSAVEKAQALDAAALARWEKYVAFVDFNTNNVGESQE